MFLLRVFLFLVLPSVALAEDKFHVDLNICSVRVAGEDYDNGIAFDNAIAYAHKSVVYRIGALYLDGLEPAGARRDTEIEVKAIYLNIAKRLDVKAFALELGGGVVFSESEAEFLGRELAEEDDESPFINVKVIKDLNDFFSLQADWKYVDDLTGGDLHLLQAGVRFSF